MLSRVKTYVEGYDENLNGGIPEGHVVLLAGTPGTMKSSLAYSTLYHNAIHSGKKGLYITLEQNKESLEEQMNSLQMERKNAGDNLAILDLAAMRIELGNLKKETLMNLLKMYVESIKRSFDYDLLVLDSIDALSILVGHDGFDLECFKLFKWLKDLKVTSFLVSELPYTLPRPTNSYELDFLGRTKKSFLSDGILLLTMDRLGQFETQRRLRCIKMRGTEHETSCFVLDFESGRFTATKAIG